MADPVSQNPGEPTARPTDTTVRPVAPSRQDDRSAPYDANVQLILRRLADLDRTNAARPRRWWQGR